MTQTLMQTKMHIMMQTIVKRSIFLIKNVRSGEQLFQLLDFFLDLQVFLNQAQDKVLVKINIRETLTQLLFSLFNVFFGIFFHISLNLAETELRYTGNHFWILKSIVFSQQNIYFQIENKSILLHFYQAVIKLNRTKRTKEYLLIHKSIIFLGLYLFN